MKEKEITVVMVEPGKYPKVTKVTTLKNDLDSLQKAVSIGADYQGLIEILGIDDGVCLLCNEEGKLIGLDLNRSIGYDVISGVFYIVGEDNHGNLTSLSEELQAKYLEEFWAPEYWTTQARPTALYIDPATSNTKPY